MNVTLSVSFYTFPKKRKTKEKTRTGEKALDKTLQPVGHHWDTQKENLRVTFLTGRFENNLKYEMGKLELFILEKGTSKLFSNLISIYW